MPKIAFLHLDCSAGPEERNMKAILAGIQLAAAHDADWVLTPEMALQGYFFTQMKRPFVVRSDLAAFLQPILKAAKDYGVFVFLGTAVQDLVDGGWYNSCVVINPQGKMLGRHDKMQVVPSKTESWAAKGRSLTCLCCGDCNVGVLVCADAWFSENGEQLGAVADCIVVSAAWPPGCGGPPEAAWERCSRSSGGKPVLICNQTGKTNGMDCTIAKSAIVLDGKLAASYQGNPAVLLASVVLPMTGPQLPEFSVLPMEFKESELENEAD